MHRLMIPTLVLVVSVVAISATPQAASARGLARSLKAAGGGPIAFGSPIQAGHIQVGPIQKRALLPKAAAICGPRCIDYRHHRGLHCKYDSCSTSELLLHVPDNCSCCLVPVPVCVPCCCEGSPTVCCHKGLFGREVVEYRWCCGFHLKVVFDRCGDVTVHYYGL